MLSLKTAHAFWLTMEYRLHRNQADSPAGRFNLTLADRPVHDPVAPTDQARRWVIEQIGPEATVAAVFGLGLGYHMEALRKIRPDIRILVHESSPAAREIFSQAGGKLPDNCDLVADLDGLARALDQALVYGPAWAEAGRLIPPLYLELRGEEVDRFDRTIDLGRLRRASNLNTIMNLRDLWLANFKANLVRVLGRPEATGAGPVMAGRPGIIVAAGPSLDRAMTDLARFRDRAVVLSVGTSFKRLTAGGIIPDVCVMIEGRDNSDQIDHRAALKQTVLAVSSVGHPAHLAAEAGLNLVFHPNRGLAGLVGQSPPIPDGGNVASAAFTLALVWGLNPIILVGQDLAYGPDGFYAAGVDDAGPDGEELISLPGNSGDPVRTTREFYSYLAWYEESAAYLARVRPDLRLINTAADGAMIKGFERLPLNRALDKAGEGGRSGGEVLAEAVGGFRRDSDYIMMSLARLRREAARAEAAARDQNQSLDRIMAIMAKGGLTDFLPHLIGSPPPDRAVRAKIRRRLADATGELTAWAAGLQRIHRRWLADQ